MNILLGQVSCTEVNRCRPVRHGGVLWWAGELISSLKAIRFRFCVPHHSRPTTVGLDLTCGLWVGTSEPHGTWVPSDSKQSLMEPPLGRPGISWCSLPSSSQSKPTHDNESSKLIHWGQLQLVRPISGDICIFTWFASSQTQEALIVEFGHQQSGQRRGPWLCSRIYSTCAYLPKPGELKHCL